MARLRSHLAAACCAAALAPAALAQSPFLVLGTDVPVQYYVGIGLDADRLGLTYRAGYPGEPYPGMLTGAMAAIGLDELYVDLIDDSFGGGWMNTLSAQVSAGRRRRFRIGLDLRHDRLRASDDAVSLLGPVLGPGLTAALAAAGGEAVAARVQCNLTGLGLRASRDLRLGRGGRHRLRVEASLAKYLEAATSLAFDGDELAAFEELASGLAESILARQVFDPYGYVGGLGVAYVIGGARDPVD